MIIPTGFDDAVIGSVRRFNEEFALLDESKCIEILMERDGMTEEEAVEYFEFNIIGAWMGEETPCFLSPNDSI